MTKFKKTWRKLLRSWVTGNVEKANKLRLKLIRKQAKDV